MIHKQFTFIHSALLVFIPSALTWLTPTYAETKYKFSVTPRFSAQEILTRFGPLTKLLGEKLHSQVEIVLASDFDDYEMRLKAGQFDIAFSNPNHYSKSSATNEVIAIGAKDDDPRMRGLIITHTDSNIKSIQDLIGKQVAIVSWDSTFGFLSQKVFLEEQGINPKTQFKLQEAHDNKQENVILSVYHGDVAAGFINEDALNIVDRYVPSQKIRVITQTTWLPDWALSVKRTLPEMVKARIRQAVLELGLDDPVLKALKLQMFTPATDADYDLVRKALEINVDPPIAVETKPATVTQHCSPNSPSDQAATTSNVATPSVPTAATNLSGTIIPLPVPVNTPLQTSTPDVVSTANATPEPRKSVAKKTSRKRKGKKSNR